MTPAIYEGSQNGTSITSTRRRPSPLIRLDAWWGRLQEINASRALRIELLFSGLILLLAGVLRIYNLGSPHQLVFDETYYVKDSWTLLNGGFESNWPDGADEAFNTGRVNGYLDTAAFVAHPPLGKWVIALGLAVFGAQDSFGWRISTAIVGILIVGLVMLVAKKLFRSTLLTLLAGTLMAVEGNAIVMSRVALLDGILALLALAAFLLLLYDREATIHRLKQRVFSARENGTTPSWGPVLWGRPWLLAAGLTLGLASGVKWSGAYFLVAFGLWVVVTDALARRSLGLSFWPSAAAFKQGPASALLMVPAAFVSYLATWSGWLFGGNGWARHYVEEGGAAWSGLLSWVPNWFQNLWHYHAQMYTFHIGLEKAHDYASSPLTWLLATRPVSMYFKRVNAGENGCDSTSCVTSITNVPNPLIWWSAAAAVLFLVYWLIAKRRWQHGAILVGFAAGYLPWLLYLNRTVFFFYSIAFEPYTILALVAVLGIVAGSRTDEAVRRQRGLGSIAVFLIGCVALSLFFYPLWAGIQVPAALWNSYIWLPGWV